MGRLKALLHAQPAGATSNATAQPLQLHVAAPKECNTQPPGTPVVNLAVVPQLQVALPMERNAQPAGPDAEKRKARALAYLEAHPKTTRACFADLKADPAHVILTVALRTPWTALEVLLSRQRFDALAVMELADRYPATSLQIPEQ